MGVQRHSTRDGIGDVEVLEASCDSFKSFEDLVRALKVAVALGHAPASVVSETFFIGNEDGFGGG